MSSLDQLVDKLANSHKHGDLPESSKKIGFLNNYWDDRMNKLEPMNSLVN